MPNLSTLPPELLFSVADKCSMNTIALCLCRVNHRLYACFTAYIRRRVQASERLPPTILLKLGQGVPIQTLKRLCSINRYYNKTLTPVLYKRGIRICRRTRHSSDSPVIRHAIFRCDRNILRKFLLHGLPANQMYMHLDVNANREIVTFKYCSLARIVLGTLLGFGPYYCDVFTMAPHAYSPGTAKWLTSEWVEMLRMLLRFGADQKVCDDRGTPLLTEVITLPQSYWCCWTWQRSLSRDKQIRRSQESSAEFLKVLVQHDPGAVVNIRDCMGYNPLHTAAVCQNLVAVEVLLKGGPNEPRPGCAARVLAIIATDKNGYTPINHATMRCPFKQTEFMYLWIIQHKECIRNVTRGLIRNNVDPRERVVFDVETGVARPFH